MAGRSSLQGSGLAKDRIVLGDVSGPLGLSLFVLGHSFLLGMGLGLRMRWAGVVKFFDPTKIFSRFFYSKKYHLSVTLHQLPLNKRHPPKIVICVALDFSVENSFALGHHKPIVVDEEVQNL